MRSDVSLVWCLKMPMFLPQQIANGYVLKTKLNSKKLFIFF